MTAPTIRQIHAILSGAFAAAVRWEWIDRNPASSARLPKAALRPPSSPDPDQVATAIAAARDLGLDLVALYVWLAAVTGARRGELCGLQWAELDLDLGLVKIRKDIKTHQARHVAIDDITVTVFAERHRSVRTQLGSVGFELPDDAYVFSDDLLGAEPASAEAPLAGSTSSCGANVVRRSCCGVRATETPRGGSPRWPLPELRRPRWSRR